MAQIDDLIKKLLEEKTASANSHISRFGDKIGVNKVLNNPLFQKLRLAAMASKAGVHQLGSEKIDSMFGAGSYGNALVDTAGVSMGLSTPFKGREIAKQIEMANVRKRLQSQAGYNNTGRDAMASTAASMANMKSLLNSTSMLAMVAGAGNHGMITPGLVASKMFGGIDAMGAATAHGLAGTAGALGAGQGVTSAIGGINPIMMGMVATIAATKASSMIYKAVIDGGSSLKLGKKELITSGTSPHQLEQDYGNTSALRQQIARMQNTGMLKPSEALIANILAMIEGHTSVLPYIAANAIDSESRRNKEGAGNAQNHLEDLFGIDGAIGSNDQLKKGRMGIVSKIFTGMEKTTANLSATFDIMGQISNTLSGQSSTKLYNEANSKDKTPEMLKAEKKFGETFGIPTGMVQAIHTTPAQIMNSTDTYEGKVLSILGLNSEINRFSAHELLKIRTTGFGIKNDTTNGFLAKLNEQYEEERLHKDNDGVGKRMLKGVDELLGYIPGFNVLSGSIKMFNGAMKTLDQFEDDLNKGKVRSIGKVFTDWMEEGITNDTLNSETALRTAVGATELGAQDQMANYLGIAYPDRFELLLSYNLSQMESLKAMAGNVDYSSNEKLTMNKYTGVHENSSYHASVDSDIKSKMEEQMDLLNDPTSWMENMFFSEENLKKAKMNQVKKGMETNDFLKSFIEQNPDSELKDEPQRDPQDREMSFADFIKHEQEKDAEAARNSGSDTAGVSSADDLTNKQREEEVEERKMSFAEQQVALLQEIRDCCTGAEGRDFAAENDRRAYEEKKAKEKDDQGGGIISSMLSSMGPSAIGGGLGAAITMLPRMGVYGLAAAGAIAAGYLLYQMVWGKDTKQELAGDSATKSLEQGTLEFQNKVHAKIDRVGELSGNERTVAASHLTNEEIDIGLTQSWGLSGGVIGALKAEQLKRGYFFPVSSDSILYRPSDFFSSKRKYYYVLMQNGEGPSIDRLFKADATSISQMIDKLDDGPAGLNPLFKKLLNVQQQLENNTTPESWKKLQKEKIKICNEIVTKSNSLKKENNPKEDSFDKGISLKATSPYTTISGKLNINQKGNQYTRAGSNEEALTFQQQFAQQSPLDSMAANYQPHDKNETETGLNITSLTESGSSKPNYSTFQPNDNGYGMSVGATQFNEHKGALKDLLLASNDPVAQAHGRNFKKINGAWIFQGDRSKFKDWFVNIWSKSPDGIKTQQNQFKKNYSGKAGILLDQMKVTNPKSRLQLIDHYNNRPARVEEILKGMSVTDRNNPEKVAQARTANYKMHNDSVGDSDRVAIAYKYADAYNPKVQDAQIPNAKVTTPDLPPLPKVNELTAKDHIRIAAGDDGILSKKEQTQLLKDANAKKLKLSNDQLKVLHAILQKISTSENRKVSIFAGDPDNVSNYLKTLPVKQIAVN